MSLLKPQYTAFLNCLKMLDRRGYKTEAGLLPSSTAIAMEEMKTIKMHTPDDQIIDHKGLPVYIAFKPTEGLTCQKDLIRILWNVLKHVDPDGSHPSMSSTKLVNLIDLVKPMAHPIVFYHNNHNKLDNIQQMERGYAFDNHGRVNIEIFQVRRFQFDIFNHVYQPKMTRLTKDDPEIVAMLKQYKCSNEPRTGSSDMAARYLRCDAGVHYLKIERPDGTLYRKIYKKLIVTQEEDDTEDYDSNSDDEDTKKTIETEQIPETNNLMTSKEYVRIIGVRAAQLESGAPTRLSADRIAGISDVQKIAMIEVQEKVCPFKIIRHLPNGNKEVFKISDMVLGKIARIV